MIENETAETTTDLYDIEVETTKKKGLLSNKLYFVLFWLIFFLVIVLLTIKCVLNLVDMPKLNGSFAEKTYTEMNVDSLTAYLEDQLTTENAKLHTAYGLDMKLLPNYQVYTSEDGTSAMVIYNLSFKGVTYTVVGYTPSNYCNGLNSILTYRNELIAAGKYTWDNSYIPKDEEVVPTPTETPTHTEDGTPITDKIDDEDEVIERGGGEEE